MEKKYLKKNWDTLGKIDAPYFILSKPGTRNGWNLDEFFKTGKDEINNIMLYFKEKFPSAKRNLALDFGCGMGRLTNALCDEFLIVHGVDIASSMIQLANFHKKKTNCIYYCLDNLSSLVSEKYDFIYSNIVLQHMEPKYSKEYIMDFFRLLSPDGVLIFQLPYSTNLNLQYEEITSENFKPRMEMYCVPQKDIFDMIPKNIDLIEIINDEDAGSHFESCKYVFKKIKDK